MELIVVKTGTELSEDEIIQINQAIAGEFKAAPVDKEKLRKTLFFLLVSDRKILAMGGLVPVEPVSFQGELFSIMGIGGIVANEKGKGYGKKVMATIINYLSKYDKTGVGFCTMRNKAFYEKCGLKVNSEGIKRFVFKNGEKAITNEGDDCVIFYEGLDNFMKKVLSVPDQEVILPRKPDW